MPNVIDTGPPGCGKGRLGEKYALEYGMVHLNSGEELRDIISNKIKSKDLIDRMAAGKLIESKLANQIIEGRLLEKYLHKDGYICERSLTHVQKEALSQPLTKEYLDSLGEEEFREIIERQIIQAEDMNQNSQHRLVTHRIERRNGFIYVGYPRTKDQLSHLEYLIRYSPLHAISLIIFLDVDEDECYKRVVGRDRPGEEKIFETRIKDYNRFTKPMINILEQKYGNIFHRINANGSKEQTDAQIRPLFEALMRP